MVSPLWKACSEGDLQKVQELLGEPTGIDIELKGVSKLFASPRGAVNSSAGISDVPSPDYTGVTPLIEAVRNGHVEIVKLLLEKGADSMNASKDGRPETYTSDATILGLLQAAQGKMASAVLSSYPHERNGEPEKQFYGPPVVDPYMYYPPINPNHPPMVEGAPYYPVGPADPGQISPNNGIGHLPPPEIARLIPCRYFPACRYGAQCMFLHPPYYQGATMPPYPPYDPMAPTYGPHYYPPPPPSFSQPPSAHSMPAMSPSPNSGLHARSPSEVVSPVPAPFSPNGAPPPPPATYGPPLYPHGQVPMPMPLSAPAPAPGPHSPHNLYNPSGVAPYPIQLDGSYHPQGQLPNVHYPDAVPGNRPENTAENPIHPNSVNGIGHHRRGSMRRSSFGSRKPPCLFFPSGRCKNGDECRFPHVLPENGGIPTQQGFPQGRNGLPRPPRGQSNGQGSLAGKLSNLNLRDDQRLKSNVDGTSRPQSGEAGHRSKFQPNSKHHPGLNGHQNHNKKGQPVKQPAPQRVPNADEFPVLTGSVTPPKLVNGSGHIGLTAAQVLQAPPPVRKEASKESSTRGTTPEPARGTSTKNSKTDLNGQEKISPVPEQTASATVNKLPVMSFAAAAAASTDVVKEVSVSA